MKQICQKSSSSPSSFSGHFPSRCTWSTGIPVDNYTCKAITANIIVIIWTPRRAIAGAAAIIGVLGMAASDAGLGVATYSAETPAIQAFFAEFVGTFILVFTVFGVIHRKASAGFAGVAIGLVVFAAIIPVAPTTGASINPARTFGPMFVQQLAGGEVSWAQLPVYLGAELLAGVLAALTYVAISRTHADSVPTGPAVPAPQTTSAA